VVDAAAEMRPTLLLLLLLLLLLPLLSADCRDVRFRRQEMRSDLIRFASKQTKHNAV